MAVDDAGDSLTIETNGDVVIATLSNGKVNALSNAVLGAIADAAIGWAAEPPGAVVLTGGPKLFAAGADIEGFVHADGDPVTLVPPDAARAVSQAFRAATVGLESLPCPVIAEVAGFALGGGCELALAADLRIASERAVFGQPEILLGLIPGGGGTQRLTRLVGPARAKELIMTGRQVRADEALAIGLVNEVVEADSLRSRVLEVASALAAGPRRALAATKRLVDRASADVLVTGLEAEERAFGEVFLTRDAALGVTSFRAHGPGKAAFGDG